MAAYGPINHLQGSRMTASTSIRSSIEPVVYYGSKHPFYYVHPNVSFPRLSSFSLRTFKPSLPPNSFLHRPYLYVQPLPAGPEDDLERSFFSYFHSARLLRLTASITYFAVRSRVDLSLLSRRLLSSAFDICIGQSLFFTTFLRHYLRYLSWSQCSQTSLLLSLLH